MSGRDDPSLVSVVLRVDNHGRSGRELRKHVRQGTQKSASVRGDCHPVSHPAPVRARYGILWFDA